MTTTAHRGSSLDPVLMMLAALAIAVLATWVVPSGSFQRTTKGLVIPGTFTSTAKGEPHAAPSSHKASPPTAPRASVAAILTKIPDGMVRSAPLIFMITALGGMFGVLRATGTLEVAIDRLVALTGGKMVFLTSVLMVTISAGSSFLGLISEYLLIITLALRLGLPALFGFALVTVAAKIGYIASVSNPVILMVAQPIAGVAPFSGVGFRLLIWVVFLTIGIFYVVRLARGNGGAMHQASPLRLSGRQIAIIVYLFASVSVLLIGTTRWGWKEPELAAFYLFGAAVIAGLGAVAPARAVHAVIDGMKSMVLAGFLVGMAKAVEIILQEGMILDTIVNVLAGWAAHLPGFLVGAALIVIEMILGLLIPSGSAKAAVSMPILVPIAQLSGIHGQATVVAYILGNGLINMFAPTSGMLLAYLATAGIPYGRWFRFVLPLFLVLTVISFFLVFLAMNLK